MIPDSQVSKESVSAKLIGRNRIIVAIGDRTTERLANLHVYANLEIIDGLEKREMKEPQAFKGSEERLLKASNPRGVVTEEAVDAIRKAFDLIMAEPKKPVRIVISGEEDLLALPVLGLYPEQTIVLYGQPDEGLVIVGATGDAKDLGRKVLEQIGIKHPQLGK
ncbi:MAG: DUF359 domain-containing protein [Nitrososphaerales archaeon]